MKKIELDIMALHHSVGQNPNYAMVLGEVNGNRRLPIVIGAFEAQAIVVAMENMTPNRPLTHDLFKNTIETFEIELKEIVINNLLEGIFYSRLICTRGDDVFEIDSRTSDAVALAVRFDCPIYVYDFILDEAGIVYDKAESVEVDSTDKPIKMGYGDYSVEELRELLEKVLSEEDYEKAALIRDEIKSRGEKSGDS
jgi:bifunctional DNase/RNase